MKTFLRYFVTILVFSFTNCQKENIIPISEFELIKIYNGPYGGQFFAGTNINFENKSKLTDSYLWDFGDGTQSKSKEKFIIHKYDSAGTYKVELLAINGKNESITSMIVEVLDRYSLLTNVNKWKLVYKYENGQNVPLNDCEKELRITFTKDYQCIRESINSANCNAYNSEERWYFGDYNSIFIHSTLGEFEGNSFFITDKMLKLDIFIMYEYVYEPE